MASKRKKLKAKPIKRTKSRDAEMEKINEYLDTVKLPKKITKDKMAEMANKLEKPKRKSPKRKSTNRKSTKRKSTDVGMKIRKLMKEGYPHKQAVAIALSMKNSNKLGPRGGYKKSPKKSKRKSPKKSKRKSPKKSKRKSPKKSKRKSSKKSKRKSSKKSKRKSSKKRR